MFSCCRFFVHFRKSHGKVNKLLQCSVFANTGRKKRLLLLFCTHTHTHTHTHTYTLAHIVYYVSSWVNCSLFTTRAAFPRNICYILFLVSNQTPVHAGEPNSDKTTHLLEASSQEASRCFTRESDTPKQIKYGTIGNLPSRAANSHVNNELKTE
jgi:hypothetical protein